MFNTEDCNIDVEEVSFALNLLHYRNLEIRSTVKNSLKFLLHQFEISQNKAYLETGVLLIQAFLNVGYPYYAEKDLFDQILTYLGLTKEKFLSDCNLEGALVKPTKYQIRKMIGKWMPSKNNPMKIGEVVADIIEKVEKRQIGRYHYKYKKMANGKGIYLYELQITEKEGFFYDLKNQKYYRFY